MKYILAVILISLFIITSYNFVAGRLATTIVWIGSN